MVLMLTLTGEYALRAMIYLAQHEEEWPITGKSIAAGAAIPAKYLSKVLGDLVRDGILASTPGKNGGFRMVHRADETRLFAVLAPFESFGKRRCPFGNRECGDDNPCLAHEGWKRVIETQQRFLQETSVLDVAMTSSTEAGRPRS